MQPSVLKLMFDISDKQYSRWLLNWRLSALWIEQFQFNNNNDNEAIEYYTNKYNEYYGKLLDKFIKDLKIFWIEKEVGDIFQVID